MWLHAVSVHVLHVCTLEGVRCALNWAKSRTDQVDKVRSPVSISGSAEVPTVTTGWESGSRRPAEEVKLFSEELPPNPFFPPRLDLDLTRLFEVRPVEPICDWRTVLESLLAKPCLEYDDTGEVFTGWIVILHSGDTGAAPQLKVAGFAPTEASTSGNFSGSTIYSIKCQKTGFPEPKVAVQNTQTSHLLS